ncbi:MAG: hypothetical protein R6U65_01245 [Perlabentimonas sp.]
MKATRKILFFSFLALALYVGINIAFSLRVGKEINLINILSIGLIFSIIYSLVYSAGISVSLKPKYDYLESEEINEPAFGDKCEKSILIEDSRRSFKEIKNEIQKKWLLTHSDEKHNIIKFRTNISFSSWGAGVVLKFDKENIKIISYPITGYTQKGNKLAMQMIEVTEKIINKQYTIKQQIT